MVVVIQDHPQTVSRSMVTNIQDLLGNVLVENMHRLSNVHFQNAPTDHEMLPMQPQCEVLTLSGIIVLSSLA